MRAKRRRGLGWDEKEGARWSAPTSGILARAGGGWVSSAAIGVKATHIATPTPVVG
jgi:hypothetical protein